MKIAGAPVAGYSLLITVSLPESPRCTLRKYTSPVQVTLRNPTQPVGTIPCLGQADLAAGGLGQLIHALLVRRRHFRGQLWLPAAVGGRALLKKSCSVRPR